MDIAGESDMFLQQVQSNNPDQRVFALHEFLRLGHSQSKFAIEILRILTEDRRIYHAERINELRQPRVFQVGDVVTVRVQMHSNASEDKVAKISYRRRGPYEIVRADGNGAYIMKKLGATDDSTKRTKEERANRELHKIMTIYRNNLGQRMSDGIRCDPLQRGPIGSGVF
jgi:hypothetical protein